MGDSVSGFENTITDGLLCNFLVATHGADIHSDRNVRFEKIQPLENTVRDERPAAENFTSEPLPLLPEVMRIPFMQITRGIRNQ